MDLKTQHSLQQQAEQLVISAERNRREKKSIDDYPIPDVLDYSHSGQVAEMAMSHLRESIPNGQKKRTEEAFRALQITVNLQAMWLRAKGFDLGKDEHELEKDPGADEGSNAHTDHKPDPGTDTGPNTGSHRGPNPGTDTGPNIGPLTGPDTHSDDEPAPTA